MFLQRLHDAVVFLLHVQRRFEPFFRPAVDAVLREPLALLTQALINLGRYDEGLRPSGGEDPTYVGGFDRRITLRL